MPGQIGLLQATEAIKLILRKGNPLIGRFLIYHSLETNFRLFPIRKNPECPLCNQNPVIRELTDYHAVCDLETASASVA